MEGNQMKMREVLEKLRAEIGMFYNNEWIPYDAWQGCDDMISHALSAPSRNCDIMSRSTCTKHFSTIYEGNRDGLCDVQTEREKNIHLYYIAFNKWLFAPADERKGVAKDGE